MYSPGKGKQIEGRRIGLGGYTKPPEPKEPKNNNKENDKMEQKGNEQKIVLKSNREYSFRARLEAGATKEELMKHYCIDEAKYNKTIECLEKIAPIQIKKKESQPEAK